MSSVTSSTSGTAQWAQAELNKTTEEKLKEAVKDAKATKEIDSANSKNTMLGKVQFPR